jgi:hypothetical protein
MSEDVLRAVLAIFDDHFAPDNEIAQRCRQELITASTSEDRVIERLTSSVSILLAARRAHEVELQATRARLTTLRDLLEACPCYHDHACPYDRGLACTCGMSAWLDRFNGVLHA